MKNGRVIAVFAVLLLVGSCVILTVGPRPGPTDLSYWLRAARKKDWSVEAAQGNPEAQFLLGLSLVRTNLVTMIDRVPLVSAIPLIGRRFVNVTYAIDSNLTQEQRAESCRWIEKSAEQGYAPAIEAKKLFVGQVVLPPLPVHQDGDSPNKLGSD